MIQSHINIDGQLASASYGDGKSEDFLWDGLALIQRGGERFINEPHIGGGNPVVSSKGTSYFNDMLGTTLGSRVKGKKYSAAALTAFGEDLTVNSSEAASRSPFPVPHSPFFTGKPHVEGLGHAFLFRNYRATLGKWQTADPLGYPDGWNPLVYCSNEVTDAVDLLGCLGVVESEIQKAVNQLVDGYVNASAISGILVGKSPTDCDNLEIAGNISANITLIEVVYSKEILGIESSDCTTTFGLNPKTIPVNSVLERNRPEVYRKRNVAGDMLLGHFSGGGCSHFHFLVQIYL